MRDKLAQQERTVSNRTTQLVFVHLFLFTKGNNVQLVHSYSNILFQPCLILSASACHIKYKQIFESFASILATLFVL